MAYSAPLGDVDELLWLLTATTLMFRRDHRGDPLPPGGLSRATSHETQNEFSYIVESHGNTLQKASI